MNRCITILAAFALSLAVDTRDPPNAPPTPQDAMRYFIDTVRWTREANIEIFYFAAFDEAWKVGAEGDVGAYWGLWDKNGLPKYV